MPRFQKLNDQLALIHAAPDEVQTLDRALAFAVTALSCDMAGVMLMTDGKIESVAVTDPIVTAADQLQMSNNEGPCLSAIRDERSFRIHQTATDQRWPRWGPAVADIGIHSVLSLRMEALDRHSVGSLNLYAIRSSAFDADDIDLGASLSRHATIAYLHARRQTSLVRAIETRTTIGQAEGMLMKRFGIDVDQAFSVLRRYSQHSNQPLREVAREIVASRRLPAGFQTRTSLTTRLGGSSLPRKQAGTVRT